MLNLKFDVTREIPTFPGAKMNKLCRQVSIESPGPLIKDSVFSFEIPVPVVPSYGARIRVCYAGACYQNSSRQRSASVCSTSSISSISSLTGDLESLAFSSHAGPAHAGSRDGALFPGYEVAGIIDILGDAAKGQEFKQGQRIVLFPNEGCPNGYADFIVVPDLKFLVPIPDNLPLSVAAMLPTGALLAMNAVFTAHEWVGKILSANPQKETCSVLIVGTGGLALWALRIAAHHFKDFMDTNKVRICVATVRDEGFLLEKESDLINMIHWSEDLYEKQLIERTLDSCQGPLDIVMDFGTSSRTLKRSIMCVNKGGVVLVTEEVGEKLGPKFAPRAEAACVEIQIVPNGTIEQLNNLVKLVASGEIKPPPHTVFPIDAAQEVVRKLCNSEVNGRAILKFHDVD